MTMTEADRRPSSQNTEAIHSFGKFIRLLPTNPEEAEDSWRQTITELVSLVQVEDPGEIAKVASGMLASLEGQHHPLAMQARGVTRFLSAVGYDAEKSPLCRLCEKHNGVELIPNHPPTTSAETDTKEDKSRILWEAVSKTITFTGKHDEYAVLGSSQREVREALEPLQRKYAANNNQGLAQEVIGVANFLNILSIRVRSEEPFRYVRDNPKPAWVFQEVLASPPILYEDLQRRCAAVGMENVRSTLRKLSDHDLLKTIEGEDGLWVDLTPDGYSVANEMGLLDDNADGVNVQPVETPNYLQHQPKPQKRGKLEITRGGNAKPRIDHAAKEKKLLEEK